MIKAAKVIGTQLTTTGLVGPDVKIGVNSGDLILGVAKNLSLKGQISFYLIVCKNYITVLVFIGILLRILSHLYYTTSLLT